MSDYRNCNKIQNKAYKTSKYKYLSIRRKKQLRQLRNLGTTKEVAGKLKLAKVYVFILFLLEGRVNVWAFFFWWMYINSQESAKSGGEEFKY